MGKCRHKKLIEFLLWIRKTDGDDLSWLEEEAKKRGRPVPAQVKKRPRLLPESQFYWNAYLDLMQSPDWVSAERYARCYGVNIDLLWRILLEMRSAEAKNRGKVPN